MPEPRVHGSGISFTRPRDRTPGKIRDEVYRQMIRLETGRPGAGIQLAVALLHAWMAIDSALPKNEQFQWLQRISPACIAMIEAVDPAQSSCKRADDWNEMEEEMEVKITHIRRTRFRVQARQHIIESDQPPENGGDDLAMTPPEIFLAALGSCAAFYTAQFLSSRKLDESGLEVRVQAEKSRDPARLGNFLVSVKTPVKLKQDQTLAMERSLRHCLIHQTMICKPQIEVQISV